MSKPFDQDDLASINTLRMLAVDATRKANSGHPGICLGLAPAAHVLWSRHMKHNPNHTDWLDRDRFVLSAGHGSMLLYGLLYLHGYGLTLDDLKNFRQWGSLTPGHPEYRHTRGVETTTGPLGQGLATAVGMAMAERHVASVYNRPGFELVNHRTWVFCSDGDLMEGLSHEAGSLAGHLKLGRLKVLWDDNRISIDGSTDLAFTEDVLRRFEAYGWRTLRVENGNNLESLDQAFSDACTDESRPTLIACRTTIGYGSPLAGTSKVHGSPLSADDIIKTKEFFHWPQEAFYVPQDALKRGAESTLRGQKAQDDWEKTRAAYQAAYPQEWAELDKSIHHDWDVTTLESKIPLFPADAKGLATRQASGKVLNALAHEIPNLFGGSADLAESNCTHLEGLGSFEPDSPTGRNIHFGVREMGMTAAVNGMALHGGVLPFGATFLIFSDYLKGSLRLSHLMGLQAIFVFTHDSIGAGEDGPTHQPIESLASLRSIPGARVFRPADANETAWSWLAALRRTDGPTCLILTRQALPTLDRTKLAGASNTLKGAYVLSDRPSYRAVLMGTGSEVSLCLQTQAQLDTMGIPVRVVSAPSLEAFEAQDASYQESVLPSTMHARVIVEAAGSFGLHRWAGTYGEIVSMKGFGASAPGPILFEKFGFTVETVVQAVHRSLERTAKL
jgi:transketolase